MQLSRKLKKSVFMGWKTTQTRLKAFKTGTAIISDFFREIYKTEQQVKDSSKYF